MGILNDPEWGDHAIAVYGYEIDYRKETCCQMDWLCPDHHYVRVLSGWTLGGAFFDRDKDGVIGEGDGDYYSLNDTNNDGIAEAEVATRSVGPGSRIYLMEQVVLRLFLGNLVLHHLVAEAAEEVVSWVIEILHYGLCVYYY